MRISKILIAAAFGFMALNASADVKCNHQSGVSIKHISAYTQAAAKPKTDTTNAVKGQQ